MQTLCSKCILSVENEIGKRFDGVALIRLLSKPWYEYKSVLCGNKFCIPIIDPTRKTVLIELPEQTITSVEEIEIVHGTESFKPFSITVLAPDVVKLLMSDPHAPAFKPSPATTENNILQVGKHTFLGLYVPNPLYYRGRFVFHCRLADGSQKVYGSMDFKILDTHVKLPEPPRYLNWFHSGFCTLTRKTLATLRTNQKQHSFPIVPPVITKDLLEPMTLPIELPYVPPTGYNNRELRLALETSQLKHQRSPVLVNETLVDEDGKPLMKPTTVTSASATESQALMNFPSSASSPSPSRMEISQQTNKLLTEAFGGSRKQEIDLTRDATSTKTVPTTPKPFATSAETALLIPQQQQQQQQSQSSHSQVLDRNRDLFGAYYQTIRSDILNSNDPLCVGRVSEIFRQVGPKIAQDLKYQRREHGRTLLHIAVHLGASSAMIRVILHEMDPNYKLLPDMLGKTALHLAFETSMHVLPGIIQQLVAGLSPRDKMTRDRTGRTCLHHAFLFHCRTDSLAVFLDKITPEMKNTRDGNNTSPFVHGIKTKAHIELMRELLRHHSKPHRGLISFPAEFAWAKRERPDILPDVVTAHLRDLIAQETWMMDPDLGPPRPLHHFIKLCINCTLWGGAFEE